MISYLFNFNTGVTFGVDFATQLKATMQWNEGLSTSWNCIVDTNLDSLFSDKQTWLFRSPGAIVYYLPFIQLPIPLGESIRIAQLILCVALSFCWLEITKLLKLEAGLQILLAVILSLWLSNGLSFVGNVQPVVATYSSICTLIVLKFCLKIKSTETFQFRNFTVLLFISLGLGGIVFIKASSLIYNCFILFSVFIFLLWERIAKFKVALIVVATLAVFSCPYLILKLINAENGVNLDSIYNQDYNNQWIYQELWGAYFTETTKFPSLLLSLTASFSTFSPFILAQTLISNFLTYIGFIDDFILSIHLNPKVVYKATVGTIFSMALGYCFLKHLNQSRKVSYILTFTLFSPFPIFCYLANKHGYNYLITGSYIQQYIPLYCLVILVVCFNLLKRKNRKNLILAVPIIFFSIGLFSVSNTFSVLKSFKNRLESKSLSTSHVDHPFFGKNVKRLDEVILEHRNSLDVPIVYLGDSSIQEMSVAYKGRYAGIGNISEQLKNPKFTLPTFATNALILIDARLDNKDLLSINKMISRNKHVYLLNFSETAKLIYVHG